jgi:hypothetical protein
MMDLGDLTEARLTSIDVSDDRASCALSLRTIAGVPVTLRAEGLVRLVVDEFREQNIVDRVTVWGSGGDPADYREALTRLLTGREADLSDPAWAPVLAKGFEAIQRGDQVLVELEPVFGAAITILAARVSVQASGSA